MKIIFLGPINLPKKQVYVLVVLEKGGNLKGGGFLGGTEFFGGGEGLKLYYIQTEVIHKIVYM